MFKTDHSAVAFLSDDKSIQTQASFRDREQWLLCTSLKFVSTWQWNELKGWCLTKPRSWLLQGWVQWGKLCPKRKTFFSTNIWTWGIQYYLCLYCFIKSSDMLSIRKRCNSFLLRFETNVHTNSSAALWPRMLCCNMAGQIHSHGTWIAAWRFNPSTKLQ